MSDALPPASNEAEPKLNPSVQRMAVVSAESETPEVVGQTPLAAPVRDDSTAMDEAAKQEFLWHAHQYLNEYAKFGDTKAAFGGTISAALLGALYSAKAHVPLVQMKVDQWPASTWIASAGAAFLLASVAFAISTILPRLRSTQSKGFIYWGSISKHGSLELLQTSFHSQSARTLNDHLLHHVFDISSKVCVPKYRSISLCIWALCIGGFLAAAALIVQDVPQNPVQAPPPIMGPASSPSTAK